MHKNLRRNDPDRSRESEGPPTVRTSFRQATILILAALGLTFCLLEGGLALLGVQPARQKEDPFVGFAGNVPLFEERTGEDGRTLLATAPGKLKYFNPQQFPREKGPDTFRIFCLGGSTTYGRPFNVLTSFPGWLGELLPAADGTRRWEVINAGGISYASYRVARLMEELARYQPDLFIVYTGHNEFLEKRTYGGLQDIPEAVRTTVGVLSGTRTWTALNEVLTRVGLVPHGAQPQRVRLEAEVNAILDRSAGLQNYTRDDALRADVLEHYRHSLERMTEIAREAGARVVFVTPASNLKDCSPFKSEHGDGIDRAGRQQVEALLALAESSLRKGAWPAALAVLDQAIAIDPRYAELHFRRGRALFALGRFEEARSAFERARDEDVCPLRALTPMRQVVAEVARERGVPLVDYVDLVERRTLDAAGHRIPGEELFLDHVHPTIEGHRLLAVALVESMIGEGIVRDGSGWPEAAIAAAREKVEARIDPRLQANALVNLAKVLHWARKYEEAGRLARQAVAAAREYPEIAFLASDILVKLAAEAGDGKGTESYLREALAADPRSPEIHLQLGKWLLKNGRMPEGGAHILLSASFRHTDRTDSLLGAALYQIGRPELAYPYLKNALRLSPDSPALERSLSQLRQELGPGAERAAPPPIVVRRYPSGAPRLVYMRATSPADDPADGIYTEWFESGSLKRYAEYRRGVVQGEDLEWDRAGRLRPRS